MTSLTKTDDKIDNIDDILGSIKDTFDQPTDEFKLPQPLRPQSTSSPPLVKINPQPPHHTDEINTEILEKKPDDNEISLLKSRIVELETQLANLKKTHEQSLVKYSEMNVTYLENQNAELRYNLTQRVQTINELTAEIEALEKMTPETKPITEYATRLKELEDQNSTLLAENLSYDVQASDIKEEMYYHAQEVERLKLELRRLRGTNEELNDQISVMQIQLANWQIDFEKEREDRSALASDRDTILTQLKYAQSRSGDMENYRNHPGGRNRPNDCVLM